MTIHAPPPDARGVRHRGPVAPRRLEALLPAAAHHLRVEVPDQLLARPDALGTARSVDLSRNHLEEVRVARVPKLRPVEA